MNRLRDTLRTTAANLTGAKMRTALTLLSIVVGAFTLTLGLGVGAGLNKYIQQQVGQTSPTDPLTISTTAVGAPSACRRSSPTTSPRARWA
jgi:putative ABC transport system permease protein